MPENNFSGEGSSLLDHLEDFRWTLLWCLGAAVVCAVPGIIFIPDLLLEYVRYVCPEGMEMHYFAPFEPLMIQLELGLLAGVIAALPFILYKLGEFVAPGLYSHERRWVFLFLISSILLMSAGVALALTAVIPLVMKFSGTFAADVLKPVIGITAFLHFSGLLSAGFALIFELPVALLLAIRMGIVSVETLRSKRPFIVVTLFVISAILTPPDVVSQLLMGMPGWILFELTLFIGGRIAPRESEEPEVPERALSRTDQEISDTEESENRRSLSHSPVPDSLPEPYVDDAPYRTASRKKRKIRHL